MTYAAYLRIYEPVAAFHEPERSRWAAYADSSARPRRRDSLTIEQAEALHRAIAGPQILLPDQESEHAYVRRADGVTYVCPWQTRLRCLLSYGRMLSPAGSALPGVIPADDEQETMTALAWLADGWPLGPQARPHILVSIWTVPLAWFVPFAAAERWLALGPAGSRSSAARTTPLARALLYTTPMPRARRRVARGLAALRGLHPLGSMDPLGPLGPGMDGSGWDPSRAQDELAEFGRWLEAFHPRSLVELDYGGLVQLLSDDDLCGDQSAAEIAAAIDGAARGERELAVAMYQRAHSRWRAFAELEIAN
jgi:hypothetical protein